MNSFSRRLWHAASKWAEQRAKRVCACALLWCLDPLRLGFLVFALVVATALSGIALASSRGRAHASLRAEFGTALSNGDAAAVMRIAKEDGSSPFWLALYSDQLGYRLAALWAAAKECRDDLYARFSGPHDADVAMGCSEIAIETSYWLGDARGYFEALAWRRNHGAALLKQSHPGEKLRLLYPQTDLQTLAASIPAVSFETGYRTPEVLPYTLTTGNTSETNTSEAAVTAVSQSVLPKVALSINGHRAQAWIDTGLPEVIVMSDSRAAALGLRHLARGANGFKYVAAPALPAGRVSLSLIRRLKLGRLTANNVLAIVVPDRYAINGKSTITLGLPALAHFDNVTFTQSSMVLNAPQTLCRHSVRMTYATLQGRSGLLVFTATVDGRAVKASVDTGSAVLLVAGNRLFADVQRVGDVPVLSASRTDGDPAYRYLALHVADLGIRDTDATLVPSLAFPDVLIGAPVLAGRDIRFTFRPTPSLCFERPSSAKSLAGNQQ